MRSPHSATKSSPCSPQLEEACESQWRPNAAKNKINKFIKKKKKKDSRLQPELPEPCSKTPAIQEGVWDHLEKLTSPRGTT